MTKNKVNWNKLIGGVFGNLFVIGILSMAAVAIFAPSQLDKYLGVIMPILWAYVAIIGIFFIALLIIIFRG